MLPAALMIMLLAVTVISISFTRVQLVELAGTGARALARGESIQIVNELLAEANLKAETQVSEQDFTICLKITAEKPIFHLGMLSFAEKSCARKSGL